MKKVICMAIVAAFIVAGITVSFAEESSKADKPMMMKKMMMGKSMMGHGMMGKSGMVATQDGGVVVMAGNKLYKYDKNLNLVKEAEVKIDIEGMKKAMKEMREECLKCDGTPECCCMMCLKKGKGEAPEEPAEPANP